MLSDFLRFFPAYTMVTLKRELSRRQFNALLKEAYRRPWGYVCMVEPKER